LDIDFEQKPLSTMGSPQELPIREKGEAGPAAFGHELGKQQFLMDPAYRNLNNGTLTQTVML
jgi:hypothetical protein